MAKRDIPRYKRDADHGEATPQPPRGRIQADLSQQAPNNSYSALPLYYEDMPFVCVDCGKEEIWTAEQQQWWYEVAKGSVYSCAVRCHDCRKARREQQEAGSPKTQPIRRIGHLMKLVRAEVDRALLDAGFVYESRNKPEHPGDRIWIDYRRDGQTFSLAYEHCDARLVAELLDESGDYQTVAIVEISQPPSNAKLLETIKQFSAAIVNWATDYRAARMPRHPSRRE